MAEEQGSTNSAGAALMDSIMRDETPGAAMNAADRSGESTTIEQAQPVTKTEEQPAVKAPAESTEATETVAEVTQEAESVTTVEDKSSPEARLKEAQRKITEMGLALKERDLRLSEMTASERAKYSKVMDVVLEQHAKATTPAAKPEPTDEEIAKMFNDVVATDPAKAVQIITEYKIAKAMAEQNGKTQQAIDAGIRSANRERDVAIERERVKIGAQSFQKDNKLSEEDMNAFGNFMIDQRFGMVPNENERIQAVKQVFLNSDILAKEYRLYLFATKGEEAFAKKTAADEAVVAAKLKQNKSGATSAATTGVKTDLLEGMEGMSPAMREALPR